MTDVQAKVAALGRIRPKVEYAIFAIYHELVPWFLVGHCSDIFQGRDWCASMQLHYAKTIIVNPITKRIVCDDYALCDAKIPPGLLPLLPLDDHLKVYIRYD